MGTHITVQLDCTPMGTKKYGVENAYVSPVHQSTVPTCEGCKRRMLFRHRWCLFLKQEALPKAASLGTMVHFLLSRPPETANADFIIMVEGQVAELQSTIDAGEDMLGVAAGSIATLATNISKALAMVAILREKYPVPANLKSLAKELYMQAPITLPDGTIVPCAAQLDSIEQDTESGRIFVRDYKTTGLPIMFTLTGYMYSIQPRLYRLLADCWVKENTSQPEVSGYLLDILQTPDIKMCGKDKDCTESEHTLTRGPRKGETEIRKDYTGEPKLENYIARCKEWYEEKGEDSVASYTIYFGEPALNTEVVDALRRTWKYASLLEPIPDNYPRDITASACKAYRRVCEYYPLCSTAEAAWPAIIENTYTITPPEDTPDSEPTTEVPE